MIKASSSGDHLDCFLAGDSAVCAGCNRFAEPDGPVLINGGGMALVVGPAKMEPVPRDGPERDLGG